MRIIWLMMGIGIVIQAVTEKNFLMLIPGLYFVFASLANIGCFAGSCATSFDTSKNNKKQVIKDIEYEEIQSKK